MQVSSGALLQTLSFTSHHPSYFPSPVSIFVLTAKFSVTSNPILRPNFFHQFPKSPYNSFLDPLPVFPSFCNFLRFFTSLLNEKFNINVEKTLSFGDLNRQSGQATLPGFIPVPKPSCWCNSHSKRFANRIIRLEWPVLTLNLGVSSQPPKFNH